MKRVFRNIVRLVLLAEIVSLSCVRYEAMPSKTKASEFAAPSSEQIEAAVSRIHHPMLKPVAVDLSDGLNPDEAALIAVALNPDIQVERDRAGIAVSQMAAARLLPDPIFSFDSTSPIGRNRKVKVSSHSFGLSFDISSLLNRRFRRQTAADEAKSINLTVAWREWQVAMAARFQCRKTAILLEQAALARRYATLCGTLRKDAEGLLRQNMMTQAQVSRFEAAEGNAAREVSRLESGSRQARMEMNQLLGLPPGTTLSVFASRQENIQTVPSLPRITKFLTSSRPDLLALWAAVRSKDARYRAEVWNQFPRIEIGLTAGRDMDNVRTAGWALSGVLPVFNGNRGNISIAKANRNLLLDEYRARLFQARADAAKMIPALEGDRKQLTNIRKELQQAKKQLKDVKDGVSNGISDEIHLLDAATRVHLLSMSALDLQGKIEGVFSVLETETGLWPGNEKQQKEHQ